jgi:hypothetical protein
VTDDDQRVLPDPVLVRLHRWAADTGLSRAAVASRLNVSRAAVAGWFLALEAREQSRPVPSSGRTFRFTDQPVDVQAATAQVLGQPVDLLRAESLSGRGVDAARATRAAAAIGLADISSDLQDIASRLVGELVSSRIQRPRSMRYRIAETVETVPGVTTTLMIKEMRGSDRVDPYQYQLVVFTEPSDPLAPPGPEPSAEAEGSGPGPEQSDVQRLREAISAALADAGLTATWEHGAFIPTVEVRDSRVGPPWNRVGSLVIQAVAASRAPSTGLLISPGPGSRGQRQLRQATLVTPPYGGSDPVGGFLAHGLDAGHLRGADVIRAFSDARAERDGTSRQILPGWRAQLDAGFAVQQGMHLLQTGQVPGAWLLSLEVQLAAAYEPLRDALIDLETPLLIVRLSNEWQALAAWRLATAKMDVAGNAEAAAWPWSSDQITYFSHGQPNEPTRRELDVLRRQHELAQHLKTELADWDRLLSDITEARARRLTGPTMTSLLDRLPDNGASIRFDSGTYETVTGDERFRGCVVFPDNVDAFVDAWMTVSLELLDQLATLAGHSDSTVIADQIASGPLRRALECKPARKPIRDSRS